MAQRKRLGLWQWVIISFVVGIGLMIGRAPVWVYAVSGFISGSLLLAALLRAVLRCLGLLPLARR